MSATSTSIALAALAAVATVCSAGSIPWERNVAAGINGLAKGRVKHAERCFERCLPFAKKLNTPDIELLFDDFAAISLAYGQVGQYERAEQWALRSIDGFERLRGKIHLDLVTPLLGLATTKMAQSSFDDAAPPMIRACRISWTCGKRPEQAVQTVAGMLAMSLQGAKKTELAAQVSDALAGKAPPLVTDDAPATAAPSGPPTPTWDAYRAARAELDEKGGSVTFIVTWFENHADRRILSRSAKAVARVKDEAKQRWRELVPFVEKAALAQAKLDAVRKTKEVDPEQLSAEKAWLKSLFDQFDQCERHLGTIERANGRR